MKRVIPPGYVAIGSPKRFVEFQPGILCRASSQNATAPAVVELQRVLDLSSFVQEAVVLRAAFDPFQTRLSGDFFQFCAPGYQIVHPGSGPFKQAEVCGTPELAQLLDQRLDLALNASLAGLGSAPWGDFGHTGDDAAFIPFRFFWTDSDAECGGVLCAALWTEAGLRAICKGTASYVSPSPLYDGEQIFGFGERVGALVSETAFRANDPLPTETIIRTAHKRASDFSARLRGLDRSSGSFQEKLNALGSENPRECAAWRVVIGNPEP